MSIRYRLLLALGIAVCALAAQARNEHGPYLLAVAKLEHALVVVDPHTLKVVARVPVGPDPHEAVASGDGSVAYVSNYGTGVYHTLARVDLRSLKVLKPIDLGPLGGPHGLAFVDGEVWFTAEGAKAVGRLNPAGGAVDWILGLGQNRTHMLNVRPDGGEVIAANVESGTMSIARRTAVKDDSLANLPPQALARLKKMGMPKPPEFAWVVTNVQVGRRPEGFDVSPDGKEAWVANVADGTLSIIDLGTDSVVATLPANAKAPDRLRFTPDGKRVLVSSLGGPNMVVMDVASRKVVKLVPVCSASGGVLVQPDGKRAFVACSPDDNIAVVDLESLDVVGRILDIGEPDGLAWAGP